MRGYEFELGIDNPDGDGTAGIVGVRRWRGSDEKYGEEFVDFTYERLDKGWHLVSFPLTPDQAVRIGLALIQEGINPMSDDDSDADPSTLPRCAVNG